MTPQELEEYLKRATPGPWKFSTYFQSDGTDERPVSLESEDPTIPREHRTVVLNDGDGYREGGLMAPRETALADGHLIAHLRNLAPGFLRLWEAAERIEQAPMECEAPEDLRMLHEALQTLREHRP